MRALTLLASPRIAVAGAAAALALAGSAPALADENEPVEAVDMTKGEKELAKLLEGRVAGEPQRCIHNRVNNRLRVIDDTAFVYGSGRTIYVQRTRNPEDIDRDDILVSRRFSASQICKQDVMSTIDPVGGFFTGVIFFEDFVPYTRVEDAGS